MHQVFSVFFGLDIDVIFEPSGQSYMAEISDLSMTTTTVELINKRLNLCALQGKKGAYFEGAYFCMPIFSQKCGSCYFLVFMR